MIHFTYKTTEHVSQCWNCDIVFILTVLYPSVPSVATPNKLPKRCLGNLFSSLGLGRSHSVRLTWNEQLWETRSVSVFVSVNCSEEGSIQSPWTGGKSSSFSTAKTKINAGISRPCQFEEAWWNETEIREIFNATTISISNDSIWCCCDLTAV